MLKSNLHCENKSVHYKLHWLLGETHRTNWEKQKDRLRIHRPHIQQQKHQQINVEKNLNIYRKGQFK